MRGVCGFVDSSTAIRVIHNPVWKAVSVNSHELVPSVILYQNARGCENLVGLGSSRVSMILGRKLYTTCHLLQREDLWSELEIYSDVHLMFIITPILTDSPWDTKTITTTLCQPCSSVVEIFAIAKKVSNNQRQAGGLACCGVLDLHEVDWF